MLQPGRVYAPILSPLPVCAALRCDAEPCQRSHALLLLRSALIPDCRSRSSLHLILAVRGGAGEALMLGEFGLKETLLNPIEVGECPN